MDNRAKERIMYLKITDPAAYHAALYVRLSKEDEAEGPSQSITNQKELLCEFAEKHGVTIFGIYVDDGFSGTNFDRPDFKRMIRDIEDQKVNMVITKDLSRLGRDYILTGQYMEHYFPEHQVRYISLLDGIDTGVESTANDITPFRAIMNDMYAKDISKKIKSVKHSKQEKGLFIGWKPPYGYKSHPDTTNKLIVDEEAAAVVRRIFSMALSGMSSRQIADILNTEKIPTCAAYAKLLAGCPSPPGGQWKGSRISEILTNEVYIGNMIQGRAERVNYKSKKNIKLPPEQWIRVEHTHAPIVDEETFQKVSLLLSSRKSTRDSSYDSLLKGIIYCCECQTPLTVMNRPDPAGKKRLFFVCRTYMRFGKSHICSMHCILVERITNAVLQKIREICREYLEKTEALTPKEKAASIARLRDSAEAEITSIENTLTVMSANLEQMYSDRLSGILEPEDFQRIYKKAEAERNQMRQKLRHIREQKTSPAEAEDELKTLAQRFIRETDVSRELLVSLVQRVELNQQKQFRILFRRQELNQTDFSDIS